MISHVSLGTNDLARAVSFYDEILKTLGYHRLHSGADYAAYGDKRPVFWLVKPLDDTRPASAGNGTHVSFVAPEAGAVDSFHRTALAMGAKNAGEPGERPDYACGYYAAFIRDPDGHKIEAQYQPPTQESGL